MSMKENKSDPAEPTQHPSTTEGLVRELGTKVLAVGQRVVRIEEDVAEMKGDVSEIKGHLIAAKVALRGTSQNDMQQDATIAAIVVDVASLKTTQAEQLGILRRLDKVATNPLVIKVAKAIGYAILLYLAGKGVNVLP
jgi:hypothetical protein